MLSTTANLLLGDDIVSTLVLMHIIYSTSKVDHGLVYSDIHPRDRQNFLSCQKICKEEVFELLRTLFDDVPGAKGTFVYLKIIRNVMIAYHDQNVSIPDRLYHAWVSVFICRMWFAWLNISSIEIHQKKFSNDFSLLCETVSFQCLSKFESLIATKKRTEKRQRKTKQHFIITHPCYLSIEINANTLTYLTVLAIDGQIPNDILSIERFNSQSCENIFRSARAMSGVSSNVVNFTVADFLRRADKINAVQSIQTQYESPTSEISIRFPKHHKHAKDANRRVTSFANSPVGRQDIEEIVKMAFNTAYHLIKLVIDEKKFQKTNCHTLEGLSKFTLERLNSLKLKNQQSQSRTRRNYRSSRLVDEEREVESEDEYEDVDDDDDDDDDDDPYVSNDDKDLNRDNDDVLEGIVLDSSNTSFHGMLTEEQVTPSRLSSYFKVRRDRDDEIVYVSKSTACWILDNEKNTLSSDRLTRVTQ